ncbi:pathogenesis-related homeodomain protein-like isoform X1 [Olea europaea var. sylvestris]|uniref:pathogenesis-related homeodomain protein-like isoform X1 n=1 Tax=Olea europaea var. sylvestris TaxID=158386 RepID=UPI000C1D7F86|nr:pathogenesis-related homeodomain protein-like isoform X1 [Olea europaea var. sylvestris]
MPGEAKEQSHKKKFLVEDEAKNLQNKKPKVKQRNRTHSSLPKKNVTNRLSVSNGSPSWKKVVNKAAVHKTKTCKKQPLLSGVNDEVQVISTKDSEKQDDGDIKLQNLKRRRKRKKRKDNVELDEASRLQRRTRYLLIKLKLEQNLIDAYSAEGWKGQSREKIKPEKELQRAKKQILKCKLGIREAIRQLDLLSSVGRIDDSAVAPDGSVHHEHIICAKCKMREALPDNDIILCDGTCNRAFHQKCLDPPLSTENIPPGDESWFCKFCKSKMDILEATNAHLGTHFPMDSNWQDVFKEEALLPDGGDSMLCPEQEWPSDDSEDDDYDPERIEPSCSDSMASSESDGSEYSSSFLGSLEDEPLSLSGRNEERRKECQDIYSELIGVDSDENNDGEAVCGRRQRSTVDYLKLHDEMFGKTAAEDEQISEDEDWGPTKRKRKGNETDAGGTLVAQSETEKNCSKEKPKEVKEKLSSGKIKRPIFRIPLNAVEKLRLVFAKNELPDRAVRENLSKQLGIEFDKVNKWFKNARYLALKARKAGNAKSSDDGSAGTRDQSTSEIETTKHADQMASKDSTLLQAPKSSKKAHRGKKPCLPTNPLKGKQRRKTMLQKPVNKKVAADFGDDVSLKLLREKAKEAKKSNRKRSRMLAAEAELKRLCEVESKVKNLQQALRGLPNHGRSKVDGSTSTEQSIVYVPVAEVREKR